MVENADKIEYLTLEEYRELEKRLIRNATDRLLRSGHFWLDFEGLRGDLVTLGLCEAATLKERSELRETPANKKNKERTRR